MSRKELVRKELVRMLPASGDDLAAAMRIVEMGYPAVGPVMRDMVRWMRVAESPVADAFAAFFGRLGEPAVDVIAEGLLRENSELRHRIFCQVLPEWPPEVIGQLTNTLTMVATQPDAHDNDVRSVALLVKHLLADPEWLRGWVQFKEERLAVRNELLMQAKRELKNGQPAGEGEQG